MELKTTDKRPQGFVDPEGTTKTPFRLRLEREARDLEIPRPPRARRIPETDKIPPPPAGYEKPTTWKRVAEAPALVMATPTGWKPCQHHLTLEEVEKPDGTRGKVVRGGVGRITLEEAVYLEVRLASLRVPGAGEREKRHG